VFQRNQYLLVYQEPRAIQCPLLALTVLLVQLVLEGQCFLFLLDYLEFPGLQAGLQVLVVQELHPLVVQIDLELHSVLEDLVTLAVQEYQNAPGLQVIQSHLADLKVPESLGNQVVQHHQDFQWDQVAPEIPGAHCHPFAQVFQVYQVILDHPSHLVVQSDQ